MQNTESGTAQPFWSCGRTNLDRRFFPTITHFQPLPELNQFIGLHKIQCPTDGTVPRF
jgi:hypothetical protein